MADLDHSDRPRFVALDAGRDRAAVRDFYDRAADYVLLETGLPPDDEIVEAFFTGAPPGKDPADGYRAGMFVDGRLVGIGELSFGHPEPADAYIGLMLIEPAARGRGLGHGFVRHFTDHARARGATRLLAAVLDANPRGRAFWEREGLEVVLTVAAEPIGLKHHVRHRMARPI